MVYTIRWKTKFRGKLISRMVSDKRYLRDVY